MLLNYSMVGSGTEHVIVLHSWFTDSASYEGILPYLNTTERTYIFADCRGYGTSMGMAGDYGLKECALDVLALADHLGVEKFHVVGHSFTGMMAQPLAGRHGDRVKSCVLITPLPAYGFGDTPDDIKAFIREAAGGNNELALQMLETMTGGRYNKYICQQLVKQWYKFSTPEARLGYFNNLMHENTVHRCEGCTVPALVIVGKHDAEAHNKATMEKSIMKWFENAELAEIESATHFPMLETPIELANLMENFLEKQK